MAWEPSSLLLPRVVLAVALAGLVLAGGEVMAHDDGPEINVDAPPAWVGTSATTGYTFGVTACDDQQLDQLTVTVDGIVVGSAEGPAECLEVHPTLALAEPGHYEIQAHARDSPDEEAHATHVLNARLLPWDLDRVEGFPPLDEVPETTAASRMDIRMLLSPEGAVKGYDVTADGHVVLSNMEDAVPEKGDESVTILLDRPAGHGELRVGGQTLWEGTVVPGDTAWWRVRPVAGILEAPLG